MGFVYRAQDRKLGAEVIIKVPRPALLQDPEAVKRFTREIQALVRLEHPHIVRVMDVDTHHGVPFAVMQYLAGGSLEDRRQRGPDGNVRPLGVEELRTWLPDIAAALDFVHEQGYVHRDVKPANILFDRRGHVFLSDFGVAKALARSEPASASLTAAGMVLGTPAYLAPELALGNTFDGKIDQYALGITLFELLSGRLPLIATTPAAILVKQVNETPPRLDAICQHVPRTVADAIQRSLEKNPRRRYPTCSALAEAVLAKAPHAAARTAQASVLLPEIAESARPTGLKHNLTRVFVMAAIPLIVVLAGLTTILLLRGSPGRGQAARQPRLELARSKVALSAGEKEEVDITVDRSGFEGPIRFEVEGLPPRVTYSLPPIPDGSTSGQLALVASAEARKQEGVVTVRALCGDNVLVQKLQLTVREAAESTVERTPSTAVHRHTDDERTNALGMQFVTLQPGSFYRGSPADDLDAKDDERPQHLVTITRPLEMAIYEVTVGQFRQFVEATGYRTDAESSGEGSDGYDPNARAYVMEYRPGWSWRNPGWNQTDNHPVVSVSWNDAMAFCRWLSMKEGRTYRLPTEAEWEYAARAGATTRYWTGDQVDSLRGAENIADASLRRAWAEVESPVSWDDGHPFTAPVGSFKPNPWGLYDMLGNACEKAADWYDPSLRPLSASVDPQGPAGGMFKTYRGGSFFNSAKDVRVAARWGEGAPEYRDATSGFRVVRLPRP
jgi:formylglycine-generating enzyme required for sulfatase activity